LSKLKPRILCDNLMFTEPQFFSIRYVSCTAPAKKSDFGILRYRKEREAMYVRRNIEARSCNHCCGGKAMSITYSECVFEALGIQHAMQHAPYFIVICDLSGSILFFSSHKWKNIQKEVTEHKTYVLIFSTNFSCDISYFKKHSARCDQKCVSVFVQSAHYSCQI
jgi:hypothetical protein